MTFVFCSSLFTLLYVTEQLGNLARLPVSSKTSTFSSCHVILSLQLSVKSLPSKYCSIPKLNPYSLDLCNQTGQPQSLYQIKFLHSYTVLRACGQRCSGAGKLYISLLGREIHTSMKKIFQSSLQLCLSAPTGEHRGPAGGVMRGCRLKCYDTGS